MPSFSKSPCIRGAPHSGICWVQHIPFYVKLAFILSQPADSRWNRPGGDRASHKFLTPHLRCGALQGGTPGLWPYFRGESVRGKQTSEAGTRSRGPLVQGAHPSKASRKDRSKRLLFVSLLLVYGWSLEKIYVKQKRFVSILLQSLSTLNST